MATTTEQKIRDQRDAEDATRAAAEADVAAAHRASVKLWSEAQNDGTSYQSLADVLGVTKSYVSKEVRAFRDGEL